MKISIRNNEYNNEKSMQGFEKYICYEDIIRYSNISFHFENFLCPRWFELLLRNKWHTFTSSLRQIMFEVDVYFVSIVNAQSTWDHITFLSQVIAKWLKELSKLHVYLIPYTIYITIFHTFELFPMYNTVTSVIVLSKATLSLDNDQM